MKVKSMIYSNNPTTSSCDEDIFQYECPHCRLRTYFKTEIGYLVHLDKYHNIPSNILKELDIQTFENLVFMYSWELREIHKKKKVVRLSPNERRRLRKEGILVITQSRPLGNDVHYDVSDKALNILKKMKK